MKVRKNQTGGSRRQGKRTTETGRRNGGDKETEARNRQHTERKGREGRKTGKQMKGGLGEQESNSVGEENRDVQKTRIQKERESKGNETKGRRNKATHPHKLVSFENEKKKASLSSFSSDCQQAERRLKAWITNFSGVWFNASDELLEKVYELSCAEKKDNWKVNKDETLRLVCDTLLQQILPGAEGWKRGGLEADGRGGSATEGAAGQGKFNELNSFPPSFGFSSSSPAFSQLTFTDKIAKLTLSVQRNPLLSLPFLQRLVFFCRKRHVKLVVECLKDLFLRTLLPDGRSLFFLHHRQKYLRDAVYSRLSIAEGAEAGERNHRKPRKGERRKGEEGEGEKEQNNETEGTLETQLYGKGGEKKGVGISFQSVKANDLNLLKLLFLWAFEDKLKAVFAAFINLLLLHLNDPLCRYKDFFCSTIFELLLHKPEQERCLLEGLVNKLGHSPSATRICGYLELLTISHPQMQIIVVNFVTEFALRNLHKFLDAEKDARGGGKGRKAPIAAKKVPWKNRRNAKWKRRIGDKEGEEQKRENQNRILSLTAASNAISYLSQIPLKYSKQSSASRIAAALSDFYMQVLHMLQSEQDIFSSSDSSKLLQSLFRGLTKAVPFTAETHLNNLNVKPLFVLSHYAQSATVKVQILRLLFTVLSKSNSLDEHFFRLAYSHLLNSDFLNFSKLRSSVLELFEEILKSQSVAHSSTTAAFIKRLLQIAAHSESPQVWRCVLSFTSNLVKRTRTLQPLLSCPESDLRDDEETYKDAASLSDDDEEERKGFFVEGEKEGGEAAGGRRERRKSRREGQEEKRKQEEEDNNRLMSAHNRTNNCVYDPLKRDPKYSRADEAPLWELTLSKVALHPLIANATPGEERMENEGGQETQGERTEDAEKKNRKRKEPPKEEEHENGSKSKQVRRQGAPQKPEDEENCWNLLNEMASVFLETQKLDLPTKRYRSKYFIDPFVQKIQKCNKEKKRIKKLAKSKQKDSDEEEDEDDFLENLLNAEDEFNVDDDEGVSDEEEDGGNEEEDEDEEEDECQDEEEEDDEEEESEEESEEEEEEAE